jgi:hypothetical protein
MNAGGLASTSAVVAAFDAAASSGGAASARGDAEHRPSAHRLALVLLLAAHEHQTTLWGSTAPTDNLTR